MAGVSTGKLARLGVERQVQRRRGRRLPTLARRVGLGLAIAIWLSIVLGPFAWMLLTSLTPGVELGAVSGSLVPKALTTQAYQQLIGQTPFLHYLANSLIVAPGTAVCGVAVALLAATALSRYRFRMRPIVIGGLLAIQLLPTVLLVIPLYSELAALHLINTLPGLILVDSAFVTPFATWLLKGFLDQIPYEITEAARIDGAGTWTLIRHVLLPLAWPGIAAAATYCFIYSWNEFLFALTFTADDSSHTIPVGLSLFIGNYIIRWDLLTAGGVVAAVPTFIGFLVMQRQLISGLTSGAVKG